MKKSIIYLSMMAAALLTVSCTNDEETLPSIGADERVPVQFTAENLVNLETKANLSQHEGDVRIAMLSENGEVLGTKVYDVVYESESQSTILRCKSADPFYYPTDGSNVKFHAYLAQENTDANSDQYTVDVEVNSIFVTAATEAGYNETTTNPVALQFKHQFARVFIQVKSKDFNLNRITATMSDQPASITYNITTNEVALPEERTTINQFGYNGGQKFFHVYPEAFPDAGATVTFTTEEGPTFKATLNEPEGGFKAGTQYLYQVTLKENKTEATFTPSQDDWTSQTMPELTPEETTPDNP